MAVIPLTSLSQFNSTVSSRQWFPRAVHAFSSPFVLSLSDFQINANRVAVIYFWAYWCGPCRGMTPIFDGAADSGSLAGVDFYRVDIDQANDIVQHVGGQTVRLFIRELAYNARFSDASMPRAHRSLVFTCISAARSSGSSSAHVLLSYRYGQEEFPG
jgi:thiol-disulfide isomerase/thioredoxin